MVASRVDRDRRRIVELSVAISFSAPIREHLSIRTELNNSGAPLIDDINRVIRPDGNPPRTVKSRFRSFPFGNETAVGRELLDSMIRRFRNVNVASAIDGDPIRFSKLPVPGAFGSDTRDERTGR